MLILLLCPTLEYGSEVWACNMETASLESIQLRKRYLAALLKIKLNMQGNNKGRCRGRIFERQEEKVQT